MGLATGDSDAHDQRKALEHAFQSGIPFHIGATPKRPHEQRTRPRAAHPGDLAAQPEGMPLAALADELDMPRSAATACSPSWCAAATCARCATHGDYVLTTKLVVARPGLPQQRRASSTSRSRSSTAWPRCRASWCGWRIVDGDRLTLVAKAQGARKGLRYDPDMGIDVRLSCSAAGHAWLIDADATSGRSSWWRGRASARRRTTGRRRRRQSRRCSAPATRPASAASA